MAASRALLGALRRTRHTLGAGGAPWRLLGGEISIAPLAGRNAGLEIGRQLQQLRFSSVSSKHARMKPEDYDVHAWTDTPYLEYIVGLEPQNSTPATSTGGATLGSITTDETRPHPGYTARLITLRLEHASSYKAREAIFDEKSYMKDFGRFWIPLFGDLLGGARHYHCLEFFVWMKDHKTVMRSARWLELERLFSMMISYAGVVGDAMLARRWFDEMEQRGMRKSTQCCNALIIAYAKDSDISSAMAIFSAMKQYSRECPPNALTFYILISMFAKHGQWQAMEEMIGELRSSNLKLDLTTYTTLLHAYAKMGRRDCFLKVYEEMTEVCRKRDGEGNEAFKPNEDVFAALLIGYSRLDALDMLQPTIAEMQAAEVKLGENITVAATEEMAKAFSRNSTSEGLESLIAFAEATPKLASSSAFQSYVVEAFAKSGKLDEVESYFEKIFQRREAFVEAPAMELVITSFCKEGLFEKIQKLCTKARSAGFKLSLSSFELLISELAKAGKYELMEEVAGDMEAAKIKWSMKTLEVLLEAYNATGNSEKQSVVSRRIRRLQAEELPEDLTPQAAAAAC